MPKIMEAYPSVLLLTYNNLFVSLRKRIPVTLRPFITIAMLDQAIETAWQWLKEAMEDDTTRVKTALVEGGNIE